MATGGYEKAAARKVQKATGMPYTASLRKLREFKEDQPDYLWNEIADKVIDWANS